uniref:Biotin/lipoyl-binding protein n=1 Tax=Anaerolinea thermolimosa TaxID=229919 RepID=A0A7C4PN02_9CHLR
MKRITVTINGKPFEVEVNDLHSSPLQVRVNGREYEVTVSPATAPSPSTTAPAAPELTPAAKPAPASSMLSGKVLSAPMPGVILNIAVKAGDKVAYGQQLCALEAMKMKNAIRSPREGTLASVEVQEGQRVNYGDVLFRFSD